MLRMMLVSLKKPCFSLSAPKSPLYFTKHLIHPLLKLKPLLSGDHAYHDGFVFHHYTEMQVIRLHRNVFISLTKYIPIKDSDMSRSIYIYDTTIGMVCGKVYL